LLLLLLLLLLPIRTFATLCNTIFRGISPHKSLLLKSFDTCNDDDDDFEVAVGPPKMLVFVCCY